MIDNTSSRARGGVLGKYRIGYLLRHLRRQTNDNNTLEMLVKEGCLRVLNSTGTSTNDRVKLISLKKMSFNRSLLFQRPCILPSPNYRSHVFHQTDRTFPCPRTKKFSESKTAQYEICVSTHCIHLSWSSALRIRSRHHGRDSRR